MLISIIIPTYNRLGPVCRAIDSVLHQSYIDFELIIVDDGSADSTQAFINAYQDQRIRYFKIEHKGVAHARNFGVKQSKSDWICFLDSDDVWRRHKLSEQIRYHDQNRHFLISQTDDIWIRNSVRVNKMKKNEVSEGDIFCESLRLCLIACSSVMINKKLFDELGGFDESFPTCEDYDLWLRITANHPVGFVNKVLMTKFGGHADQLSKAYPMMDQYRILALGKLIKSVSLSGVQKELVGQEIEFKKNIIEKGQKKRQL